MTIEARQQKAATLLHAAGILPVVTVHTLDEARRVSEALLKGGLPAIADAVIERYFSAAFRAAHADTTSRYRETLLRTDPQGYVACCHAVRGVDWLDRLDAIRCPTLTSFLCTCR